MRVLSLNLQEKLGKQYDELQMAFSLVGIGIALHNTVLPLKEKIDHQPKSRANDRISK